jgi:hypothetical protein
VTYDQKPAQRPLPATLPEYIIVKVYASEYRGQPQWVAQYCIANNGKESDYLRVVVNFRRHQQPKAGLWWVKPTNMAPHLWLVFAEACGEAADYSAPPPVRTGDQLVLRWCWRDNGLVSHHLGWSLHFTSVSSEPQLFDGEFWLVKVTRIDPLNRRITVAALGPDPRVAEKLSYPVGYVGLYSLDGQLIVEGGVYDHWVTDVTELRMEPGPGRSLMVTIKDMRWFDNQLIGLVRLWEDFRSETRLVEVVPIEGSHVECAMIPTVTDSTSPKPPRLTYEMGHCDHYGREDEEGDGDIVRREEFENSERPEIDYSWEDVEQGADED